MLVSVIVPCYNEGAVIRESHRSLVAGNPVIEWFNEHYRPLPNNPDREGYFVLFMRRGGKIEARMESAVNKNQTR